MQLSFADARPRRGLVLTVLPDSARVEERLARAARERGLAAGRIACTVAELERELVREARRAGRCPAAAPPYALELAVAHAAREQTPRGSPFHAIREEPGYARALTELWAALGQGLLEPQELLDLALPAPVRERIVPLARVLLAARARLDRAQLVEPARALRLALDGGVSLPAWVRTAGEVHFDAILDWTPLRIRMASILARNVRVRVRLPFPGGRPELAQALEPALRAFERLGDGPAPELELFDPESGPLAPFLSNLFAAQERAPAADAPVRLISSASPTAQARDIARACADLLVAGEEPDDIAITARSLGGGVAEELAAALDSAGVPWRERRGRPALAAAPIRLALSIYELLETGIPREALIELLCSRLLWLSEEHERLPPYAVARILRAAHLRDDLAEGGLLGRLDAYELRQRKNDKDTKATAETRARVSRVLDGLRPLPEKSTVAGHGAALLGLLRQWGLERHLRSPVPEDGFGRAASAAMARDQAGARLLEETCAALARAARAVGLGDEVQSRSAFRQLLADSFAAASLRPGGARGGAVQLVELREVHGRSFAHLFAAGLLEGQLPAVPAPDPFLSDEHRRAINRAAGRPVFHTPGAADSESPLAQQAEEPLLFHLALCAATRSASLHWPRADLRGRDVLRSPFVDEAIRALGRAPEDSPVAAIPPRERCRSASDLLARGALDAFAEPAYRVTPPPPAAEALALLSELRAGPLAGRMARIARAALAERERVRVFVREIPPGRFSGQLSGAALDVVAPLFRFGSDHPLSAGQLEDHSICAFRTLGKRVLHVAPDELPDDELSARERGTLLHLCLEKFFNRLEAEGRQLTGSAEDFGLLRETTEGALDSYAAQNHVGHPGLWRLKRAEVHREVAAVVESEAAHGPRPIAIEARFGFKDEWEALSLRDGDDEISVRGAIDRVDRTPDGVVVLDYKSSRPEALRPRLKALLDTEFQLPIYAAVLRQRGEPRVDAAYVSLRQGTRTDLLSRYAGGSLDRMLELDPARRAALRAEVPPPPNLADEVFKRVRQMRAGTFEVRPVSCDYCELRPACRLVALPTDPDENGGEQSRA